MHACLHHAAAIALAASFAGALLAGCEREDTILDSPATQPTAVEPAEPPPSSARRPTTQQLTEGNWKTVPVSMLPLTISVPQSWETAPLSEGGLLTLEGFSPSGFVQLRMAIRTSIPADTVDAFIASAKSNAEAQGDRLKKFDVRKGDPLTLVERQITGERQLIPSVDEQGNLIEVEGTPLRWSVLVLLKKEQKFDSYELWFDALSLEHYRQDQAFLQKIVDSLAYDASRK